MTVLIGIPTLGALDPTWVVRYHALRKPARADGSPDWSEAFVMRQVIHLARNLLAWGMLTAADAPDHLFMLDDDVYPNVDVLTRLLSHNEPIVSGLYVRRMPPHSPIAYRLVEQDDEKRYEPLSADEAQSGELLEVDAVGAGCLLIRRDVLERMRDLEMTPFQFMCSSNGKHMSEDMWFCEQARILGYHILLDTSARCGHAGQKVYGLADAPVSE